MKSTASLQGHPLHPLLIAFPVAFFTGTLVCDVAGLLNRQEFLWQMGRYLELAGIVSGAAAAIPGVIDFIYTVPPQSSAKSRAAKHGSLNAAMLILFAIAAIIRKSTASMPVAALEAAGFILLLIAGWMGGVLVYRNQIAVNPRYAGAGKWKEVYLKPASRPLDVAASDELKIDQMKLLHIGDKRIVLARNEQGYTAFDDRCSHRGGSLAGGAMICGTVQCPWHGSQFRVTDGQVKAGPARYAIRTYPVNETGGRVYLLL
jgi:uncharacterized membrane protein/nitrite reductase/ring-hydroxylating ferredoxin subunit